MEASRLVREVPILASTRSAWVCWWAAPRTTGPCFPEWAFREEGVKVTLARSRKRVEFFKEEAAKQHTQYQRMIRRLIDA
jgi:hypothetical protein